MEHGHGFAGCGGVPNCEEEIMHRNVTAIYRTHATAQLVRQQLEDLGVSRGYIHVIPDVDEPVGTAGTRDNSRLLDELHDLHLPDDDVRTYQNSVRRGDYVVSVEVDEDDVPRVVEVMRRPEAEAHDIDRRATEFADEALIARREEAMGNPAWRGERDPDWVDPYTRTYRRDSRLDERRYD
jgi:hypothetical protein